MIHDDEKKRRARCASSGDSRPTLVIGGINFGPGRTNDSAQREREKIQNALRPVHRPARDSDALEKRVEELERRWDLVETFLRQQGFDFDGPPVVAEASS